MGEEIDCFCADEIVCPRHGYETTDSREYRYDSDAIKCPECRKKFEYERVIDVTCITEKAVEE